MKFNIAIGVINIILFIVWFFMIVWEFSFPSETKYFVNVFAVLFSVLALFIAGLGIWIGLLAIFGYNQIIKIAEDKAEEAAENKVSEYFRVKKYLSLKMEDGKFTLNLEKPQAQKKKKELKPVKK